MGIISEHEGELFQIQPGLVMALWKQCKLKYISLENLHNCAWVSQKSEDAFWGDVVGATLKAWWRIDRLRRVVCTMDCFTTNLKDMLTTLQNFHLFDDTPAKRNQMHSLTTIVRKGFKDKRKPSFIFN